MNRSQLAPTRSSNMMRQQIQKDSLNTKNMYNVPKIWHKNKRKRFFFPSLYTKMNWTFIYLKAMRRINQSSERKKEKKSQERKKTKIFFPFNAGVLRLTQIMSNFLILSNRQLAANCHIITLCFQHAKHLWTITWGYYN